MLADGRTLKNALNIVITVFIILTSETISRQYRNEPSEYEATSGLFNIRTVSKQCGNMIYTLDKDSFDYLDRNKNGYLSTYEIKKALQVVVRHTSQQKRWLKLQHRTLVEAADLVRNIFLKKTSSSINERVSWIDVITIDCDDLEFLDEFYRDSTVVRSQDDHWEGRSSYWPDKKFGSTAVSQRQILKDFLGEYRRKRRRY